MIIKVIIDTTFVIPHSSRKSNIYYMLYRFAKKICTQPF